MATCHVSLIGPAAILDFIIGHKFSPDFTKFYSLKSQKVIRIKKKNSKLFAGYSLSILALIPDSRLSKT